VNVHDLWRLELITQMENVLESATLRVESWERERRRAETAAKLFQQ
jgi:hypothetical protein